MQFASPSSSSRSRSNSSSSTASSSRSQRSTSPSSRPPPPTTSNDTRALPPALPALVLRKVVASNLVDAGFDTAHDEAIEFLEGSLVEFFETLVRYSHDLAELSRRHEPTLEDVVEGCAHLGLATGASDLLHQLRQDQARSSPALLDLSIEYAKSAKPRRRDRRRSNRSPALLPSDDDVAAFSDPDPDPALESPPPSSPSRSDFGGGGGGAKGLDEDEDDEDDDFEEVVPLGQDGQPIPPGGGVRGSNKKKDASASSKGDSSSRHVVATAARTAEREARRRERERRRCAREFRNREYGKTFEADWMPKLPPKHSWKQTPVFPEQPPPPPIPDPVSRTAQAPSDVALAHLSTLRARLHDSQLVASSLRNLIRRTGASARGNSYPSSIIAGRGGRPTTTSMTTPAAADGQEGDDDVAQQRQQQQLVEAEVAAEQEADLVSYETSWYGSNKTVETSAEQFKRGVRHVRTIRVGNKKKSSNDDDDDDDDSDKSDRDDGRGGGGGRGGAKRDGNFAPGGGGVAKRRRWLV